ncbi:MAG TPA: hypothetical protein PKD49_05420 [Hyphomicrobium sp.]|nr:hypothetical protein [Hyphomicrobium sp.]
MKCCKRCEHAWFNDYSEFGYCKLAYETRATIPKPIGELHVCDHFAARVSGADSGPK